jgi:hypothetical protein
MQTLAHQKQLEAVAYKTVAGNKQDSAPSFGQIRYGGFL